MRLPQALKDKRLDLRLRDKLVHEGKVSFKELASHLSSLEDDADKVFIADSTKDCEEPDPNGQTTES